MRLLSIEGGSGRESADAAYAICGLLGEAGAEPALLMGASNQAHPTPAVLPSASFHQWGWEVLLDGSKDILGISALMGREWIVASGFEPLAAPMVAVDEERGTDSRAIGAWKRTPPHGNDLVAIGPNTDPRRLLSVLRERVFPILPQMAGESCGRCGADCLEMAGRIVQGRARREDCVLSTGGVRVKVDGRLIPLGDFPARLVGGTIRGLLSSLKGYQSNASIEIELH